MHLADRVAFSQRPPLRVARCEACGLIYRNPRERAFELRDIYEEDALAPEVYQSLFDNQRAAYRTQVRRLTGVFGRRGTALEVGSYVGAFLAAARDGGWNCTGLDVNEPASEFARQQGLSVELGALDDREAEADARGVRAAPVDAVVIWNCFEQLADPRAVATAAHARLAPGGIFVVRVPNGAAYAALVRIRRGPAAPLARALLAHNNLLGFPYRHGFTLRSLSLLFERTGFRVERVYGDALVPIADQWTRGWAALEERTIKRALRLVAKAGRAGAATAPWIEVYGRVVE